jgi:hypothetical protein
MLQVLNLARETTSDVRMIVRKTVLNSDRELNDVK